MPIESLVGSGWDQLLALVTLISMVAAFAGWFLVFWLQSRLGKYFVPAADHRALVEKLNREHAENIARIVAVEDRLDDLATKHSMVGLQQSVTVLYEQVGKVREGVATVTANIQGMAQSNASVEHMMRLVLDHMLERDKAP